MSTIETKVRHTAGKWDLSDTGYLTNEGGRPVMSSADVADEGRKRVCVVDIQAKAKRGHGWETPCAERDANALLIAAAPDMLEALEVCIGQIEGAYSSSLEDNEPVWLKQARAAIAKARGIA